MILLREAFLFRLETVPPAYLWSGVGDLVVPADAQFPQTTYKGAGQLLNVPELQEAINGVAARIDFSVSGVNAEMQALAVSEEVKGSKVVVGTIPLDDRNQIAGDVFYEMEGTADVVSTDRSGDAQGGVTRSITLSVLVGDGGRSRPDLTFFTDADQRKRSPTDAFFSHIASINAGVTRPFGPK